MGALWLLLYVLKTLKGQSSWYLLLGCVAVLLVKRVTLSPGVLLFVVVSCVAATYELVRSDRPHDTRFRFGACVVLSVAWLGLGIDWHLGSHRSEHATMDSQRPVVCLGDSLTSGVAPYGGYPDKVAQLLSVPVVNFGREGITTEDALKDLPAIRDIHPQAVVIELGGHDFLKGHSRAATKANLEKLILSVRNIGAEVILVEVPRGFITDPFAGIEREIARELDVELLPDGVIRQLVFWSPVAPPGMWFRNSSHLSDDGLHPNEAGNLHLALSVADSLRRVFGNEIRAAGR